MPEGEYQFAGVYSFGRGVFRSQRRAGREFSYATLTRLRKGEFVYPKLMAWEGAFGVTPPECDGCYVSPEFPVFQIDETRLTPSFIGYYFQIPRVWERLSGGSTGTNVRRRRLHPRDFLRYEIPLPPLAEQIRIVARIEALAPRVREAQLLHGRVLQELDSLRQKWAAEMFDEIERAHPSASLGDYVEVRGGGTPSKSSPHLWNGGIPWVSPKDMKSPEIFDARDHISEEATDCSPAKLIAPGAVLVVVRGMILARTFPTAVLRVAAAINQDMKALLPRAGVDSTFLASFLRARRERILTLVEKSTHDTRKLDIQRLLDVRVPIVSIGAQQQLLKALNALEQRLGDLIGLHGRAAEELNALGPSLLDRAFSGLL